MADSLLEKETIVNPYSRLATIYDDVMSHVDYKHWAHYIHRIIKKWHPLAGKVVDISCGTGNMLLNLNKYGYTLSGFDLSFEMTKIAWLKFNQKSIRIPVWQGNMQTFKLKKNADSIICIYDSVNYLHNQEDISDVLNATWENLNDQGLFIFDICTARNSIDYFQDYYEQNGGKDYSYTRHSTYSKKYKIHKNKFVISFDSEDKKYIENHEQKIYAVREMMELIENSNFSLVGFFDGFSFRKGSERSYRIHFVLKKE